MKYGIVMFILSGGSWYQMDAPLKVYTGDNAVTFCNDDVEEANENRRFTGRGLDAYIYFECKREK